MSETDRKISATQHSFREALDDLQSLSIPEHPANDLGVTAFEIKRDALKENPLEASAEKASPVQSAASHTFSEELKVETVLDTIADGIDAGMKRMADKLKHLDQKLSKLLATDESQLPQQPLLPTAVKKRKKKLLSGEIVEVEETEPEPVAMRNGEAER